MARTGLFLMTFLFFATPLCIKLASKRPGGDLRETRKLFCFSDPVVPIAAFGRICHDFRFLAVSGLRPPPGWPVVNKSFGIRLPHRYQHSLGFSDVKSRSCKFVDNRGIILVRIREQKDRLSKLDPNAGCLLFFFLGGGSSSDLKKRLQRRPAPETTVQCPFRSCGEVGGVDTAERRGNPHLLDQEKGTKCYMPSKGCDSPWRDKLEASSPRRPSPSPRRGFQL